MAATTPQSEYVLAHGSSQNHGAKMGQPLGLLPPGVHDRKVLRPGIDAARHLLEDERRHRSGSGPRPPAARSS
jgi:hypothetical protein